MKTIQKVEGQPTDKIVMVAYDLYLLRYKKNGEQWYELTDYLRDKLVEDGHTVEYKKDTMIFDGLDFGKI